MTIVSLLLLNIADGIIISFIWILLSATTYFGILWFFPSERQVIIQLWDKIYQSVSKKNFIIK